MFKMKSMTTIAKEEVAEKMIADGLSDELIAKYTDLSRREINTVRKWFLKNREHEKNILLTSLERQIKQKITLNLIDRGLDMEEIVEITDLSHKDIRLMFIERLSEKLCVRKKNERKKSC